MSGIDKIVEKIILDANMQREKIIEDAEKRAKELLEGVRVQTQKECDALVSEQKQKAENADKISDSSGELRYRQLVLAAKKDVLDDILKGTQAALNALEASEYFDLLSEMVCVYAHGGEKGFIRFNKRDLQRLPEGYINKLNNRLSGSLILDETQAAISGGFLLIYGDIEENCSFEAVIASKAHRLSDIAAEMLFSS
ncbi:MAG: V-type ATP synthase subunit E [Firmicutes bacterium ADurb.Bin300]|nr:MAG: V-type ATP synthase subunit E [Firmicutes bacterium ADurb.Bin300]HOD02811.1 V-type ATP synthase subunit E family protein [Clostridiales bacterium]